MTYKILIGVRHRDVTKTSSPMMLLAVSDSKQAMLCPPTRLAPISITLLLEDNEDMKPILDRPGSLNWLNQMDTSVDTSGSSPPNTSAQSSALFAYGAIPNDRLAGEFSPTTGKGDDDDDGGERDDHGGIGSAGGGGGGMDVDSGVHR